MDRGNASGSLEGKAFVTGAAGDIGRRIADRLEGSGCRVIRGDLSGGAGIVQLDVRDEAAVRAAFDEAESDGVPVSILVTCAGIMPAGKAAMRIAATSLREWDDVLAVNATGTFLCLREFLRRREADPVPQGRAILLSSAAAQLGGYRGSASYVASKAALLGLTKIAAREAAGYGVTVNCIAAGPIEGGMFDAATTPESAEALAGRIPIGRIGTPDDVAAAALYLAGAGAEWVTGATLDVNGGYRMQ